MPKFYGIDYYSKCIAKRQGKLQSFLLKKNFTSVLKSVGSVKDEIYRKPWNAFAPDQYTDAPPLEASRYVLPLLTENKITLGLKQEEPPGGIHVRDVMQGLFIENFVDQHDLIDPPIIADTTFKSQNSESRINKARSGRVDRVVPFAVSNVGKEVTDKIKRSDAILFSSSREVAISRPLLSHGFDPIQNTFSLPRVEVNVVSEKVLGERMDQFHNLSPIAVPSRKNNNDELVKNLLEGPLSCDNDSSNIPRLSDLEYQLIDVEEETLDLSVWDLNHMEPCPSSITHLLLSHPALTHNQPDCVNCRFDTSYQLETIEPMSDHLHSLTWNPFLVESVSENVKGTIENLTHQHISLIENPPCNLHDKSASVILSEEFKLESDSEISVQEWRTCETKDAKSQSPNPCFEVPQLGSLPHVFTKRKNFDLNDSVTKFMALRRKGPEIHTKDGYKCISASAASIVVSDKCEEMFTEEISCDVDEVTSKFVTRIFEYCQHEIKTVVSKGILKDLPAFIKIEKASLEFLLQENIKCDDKVACSSLLKLIPMKNALDMALQLDTEASLDFLKTVQHGDDRLAFCIQELSQIQFQAVLSGHKTPKMLKLCYILANDPGKCLVLINGARQIKSALVDTIVKISGIPVAPAISFPDYKCYLINTEDITPEFPLEKFSSIIEYNETTASLRSRVSSTKAKHYIMKTILPDVGENLSETLEEFKVVAYSSLDYKVLQYLESEYNFVVFQRKAVDQYSHETMIIDERTCIVIVRNLSEIRQVRLLSALFIKISLRYTIMNVIFDVSTCHHADLYSVVFASTAHFQPDSLNIRFFYCLSVDEICKRIVKIAHDAKANISVQWKSTELWLKRTWLTEEESNHEKLLSQVPNINSYVAQIMLTTYSLKDLMELDLEEMIQNMPVIPEYILKMFHAAVHLETHSEHNKTVQFDTQPLIQEYTPTQVDSPDLSYQRTSLPPLNSSFDMGEALSSTYQTPRLRPGSAQRYNSLIKTPMKPQNIVRPFLSRNNCPVLPKNKRAIEEKHRYSFSFSKHRKVMVDRENVKNDGQATLFIGN